MAATPASIDDAWPPGGQLDDRGDSDPDLTVVVVTHDRTELALETLHRARAAAEGLAVEWLVVDSGSSQDTPAAIERSFADVNVQRLGNVGFAAANNVALAAASGRYILLLNPDCVVASGTFAALIRQLDAQPSIGVASVIQRAPDGSLQHSIRRYPSLTRALGEALGASRWAPHGALREEVCQASVYLSEQSCDWLVGAFLIARREAVLQIGLLDERFFLYSEETDWCYRFKMAGWKVQHVPAMVMTHHTGTASSPALAAQLSYAKVLFARKHYGPRRASLFRHAVTLRHLLRVVASDASGHFGRASATATDRRAAEHEALAVLRGRIDPPFGGPRLIGRQTLRRGTSR